MRCLGANDPDFPQRLRQANRPPRALWVEGAVPDGTAAVAVVGSRAASGSACEEARRWAEHLAVSGYDVVSGGAFGVDAAAHEGALAAAGRTFAVLGCGVDVVYPDRHDELFRRIAATGGLLSEHAPGTPPRRQHFPSRNRLIVALASAVVVVEAQPRSGALVTARLARQAGKPLLVRPGSAGCDALLAAGNAVPVASERELDDGLAGRPVARRVTDRGGDLSAAAASVFLALRQGPALAGEVARRSGLPLPQVMAELMEAELAGRVLRTGGGHYEVARGDD